jgi:hypothetical protein
VSHATRGCDEAELQRREAEARATAGGKGGVQELGKVKFDTRLGDEGEELGQLASGVEAGDQAGEGGLEGETGARVEELGFGGAKGPGQLGGEALLGEAELLRGALMEQVRSLKQGDEGLGGDLDAAPYLGEQGGDKARARLEGAEEHQ